MFISQQYDYLHIKTWRMLILLWMRAYWECLEEGRPVSIISVQRPIQGHLF